MNKQDKVKYVKGQGQTRDHHCHWPGCGKQVPPAMWGCYHHWMKLPKRLRDKIWSAYRPGQEVNMTPSREYLKVAEEVEQWILDNYVRNSTPSSATTATTKGKRKKTPSPSAKPRGVSRPHSEPRRSSSG